MMMMIKTHTKPSKCFGRFVCVWERERERDGSRWTCRWWISNRPVDRLRARCDKPSITLPELIYMLCALLVGWVKAVICEEEKQKNREAHTMIKEAIWNGAIRSTKHLPILLLLLLSLSLIGPEKPSSIAAIHLFFFFPPHQRALLARNGPGTLLLLTPPISAWATMPM